MAFYTIDSTARITQLSMQWPIHRRMLRASDGKLWVFYGGHNSGLWCAYSSDNGATWTPEQVRNESYLTDKVSAVIDSSDVPHVVFLRQYGASNYSFDYVNRVGGSWSSPVAVQSSPAAQGGTMAIDSNDDLHVAYNYASGTIGIYTSYAIGYKKNTSGSWGSNEVVHDEVANGDTFEQISPMMAVDSSDVPHIVWRGETDHATHPKQDTIRYNNRSGGSWGTVEQVQDVDTNEANDWSWGFHDLRIDSNDYACVIYANLDAYSSGDAVRLFYTWRVSSSSDWANNRETALSSASGRYEYNSISITTSDVVQLVYEKSSTIRHSYRTSATADWANNDEDLTSATYPNSFCMFTGMLGAVNPPSNKFATNYCLFFYEINRGTNDDQLLFYEASPTYPVAVAGHSFGTIIG